MTVVYTLGKFEQREIAATGSRKHERKEKPAEPKKPSKAKVRTVFNGIKGLNKP